MEKEQTGQPAEEFVREAKALLGFATTRGKKTSAIADLCEALDSKDNCRLLTAYAALAAETKPVNGRTILDSKQGWKQFSGVLIASMVFFALAIGNEMADAWLSNRVDPPEDEWWLPYKLYGWDILAPFFWGGLGSCVYLLKVLWDKQADFEFENDRFRGWGVRVILGALLGGLIQYIVDPSSFEDSVNLNSNALAFLTGVGVKVVYGALEKIIETLSDH